MLWLHITIIIILLGVFLYFFVIKNKSSSSDGYYLYNNKLGTLLLTFTIIATQIGGGVVVGVADESYKVGFASLLYPLGGLTGLLIVAFIFGDFLKNTELPTISAIFEKKYKFSSARKCSSIISSLSLFSIMVAQGVAIRHLLDSVGFDNTLLFILIWCSVIMYTSFGGIKAVIHTNILQITLISAALLIILFSTLSNFDLTSINLSSSTEINYYSVLEWFIWPCCYMLIEQDMAQLFFSAKSKNTVKNASIMAAVGIFILATIPAIIGVIANAQPLYAKNGVLLFFTKTYLSATIYGITAIAIILAITSTVDSLLCAISSNIAYDFSIAKSHSQYLPILTTTIGILSLIIVFYCENIINILMLSYSFCVSTLFIPSVLGFLLPEFKLQKSSVVFSSLFGMISLVILLLIKSNFTYLSILFSAIGYLLPLIFRYHKN